MSHLISTSAPWQSSHGKSDQKSIDQLTDDSKETGLYSTPHAPRYPKPFVLGCQSAIKLKRSYKYLNNDTHAKSYSTSDLGKRTTKMEKSKHVHTVPVNKPALVQPFRRSNVIAAPEGVPILDLRQFNETDEEMQPIELVNYPHPLTMDTDRTDISWGTSRISPKPFLHLTPNTHDKQQPNDNNYDQQKNDRDHCSIEEVEGIISNDKDDTKIIKPITLQDEKELNYVENRVISQERGRDEHCHPTQIHVPSNQTQNRVIPSILNDRALSKRIRFSARVLTQNGRDLHRELCGFFFLADNSLTIYEFRRFGQKFSALPLIPRAVYKHPVGKRTGEIYEIRHIKKGSTLYFNTLSLGSLSESLKRRSIVGIRVSDIDDNVKHSIMKSDLKPSQYSQIDNYLCQSPSEESKRNSKLLQTLQGMLRNRLKGRASQVLVGLGRYLKRQSNPDGLIEKILLQQGMRAYHISLTPEDFDHLWDLLQEDHGLYLSDMKETQEGVWIERIISGLIGEMIEDRKNVVRKVFLKMDSAKSGSIMMSMVYKYFSPLSHPDVIAKHKTVNELTDSLFSCLQNSGSKQDRGCVTYADFEHYHDGLSIETKSDNEFINIMMQCWSV